MFLYLNSKYNMYRLVILILQKILRENILIYLDFIL